MALSEKILGPALKAAVQGVNNPQDNQDAVFEAMAKAIIDHFKSAGVVNTVVTTTGTAAAQAGTGVGSIS